MMLSSRQARDHHMDAIHEAIADLKEMSMIISQLPDDIITDQARELLAKAAQRVASDLTNSI